MKTILGMISLFGLVLACSVQAESELEKKVAGLNPQVLEKVTAAAPEKATVAPSKPRKILIYGNATGFYHGSIPLACKAVQIMGKKTGAFDSVITDDPAAFDPENLKQFDAIFLAENTGEMLKPSFRLAEEPLRPLEDAIRKAEDPLRKEEDSLKKQEKAGTDVAAQKAEWKKKWDALQTELAPKKEELKKQRDAINVELAPKRKEYEAKEAIYKKALLDFVNSGKGIAGAHACTDCYYGWREYGEMMGGYFSGHPYNKHIAKIDDPQSPLMAAFEGKPFPYADEMYVFGPKGKNKEGKDNQTYSREKQRVLMSIDAEASKIDIKAGGRGDDGDYAISWIKSQGQGRVFYCSYGHNDSTWYQPVILRHFLDGIQFAFGDLKADTTPKPLAK
ncbi:MAG TPA: ThuA domain-containing protein [Planctomycetota bacterium]|jgi:hypothetical protein